VPIVIHDETLERTTNGTGAVAATEWAAIRTLDAGRWRDAAFAGERVPSLDALCSWAAGRSVGLALELKQPYPGSTGERDEGLARSALDVVRAHGVLERTVFHSFDDPSLAAVLALEPAARTGLLFGGRSVADPLPRARALPGLAGIHLPWTWISAGLCEAAHAAGFYVHAWGLGEPVDPAIVRAMVRLGIDSISADDPRALVALLRP